MRDLLQEINIIIWTKVSGDYPLSYYKEVAKNAAIDYIRKQQTFYKHHEIQDDILPADKTDDYNGFDILLQTLNTEERVIANYLTDDYNHVRIAKELGVTRQAIEKKIKKMREKLKKVI